MKNKKGFTLIELLGVIILLGLILVIIIPKVSDSIEKAKKNTAIDSALAYISASRDYYNANILDKDCAIKKGKNYVKDLKNVISISGTKPTDGYFTLSENKIIYAKFCIKDNLVVYDAGEATITGDCSTIGE